MGKISFLLTLCGISLKCLFETAAAAGAKSLQLCLTLLDPVEAHQALFDPREAHQASLSFTICWSLLKLMCIESVMTSNYLILCHPLLLPSIFPSIRRMRVSSLHQVAKVLEFQLQHQSLQ